MKKNEKIYGIHPAIEFIKVSPDRIINIWIQEELKSESILSISNMAESIGLSIQHSKKEILDKIYEILQPFIIPVHLVSLSYLNHTHSLPSHPPRIWTHIAYSARSPNPRSGSPNLGAAQDIWPHG